jgi:glycosyltransferase involved in cell wall biosynthesis
MISVIFSARNAARPLAATLRPLIPRALDGIVRQVIAVDGRSSDSTAKVADDAGADIVDSAGDRGAQLADGAARAAFLGFFFLMPERFSKTVGNRAPRHSCDESIAASGRWPPAPSPCGLTIRE